MEIEENRLCGPEKRIISNRDTHLVHGERYDHYKNKLCDWPVAQHDRSCTTSKAWSMLGEKTTYVGHIERVMSGAIYRVLSSKSGERDMAVCY